MLICVCVFACVLSVFSVRVEGALVSGSLQGRRMQGNWKSRRSGRETSRATGLAGRIVRATSQRMVELGVCAKQAMANLAGYSTDVACRDL